MNLPFISSVIWILSTLIFSGESVPNFLIFYVDDLSIPQSWSESQPDPYLKDYNVTYYDAPTPNIDAFRNEAIVFSRAYAGGPVCSPSRYSILTGRYAPRSQYAKEYTLEDRDGTTGTIITATSCKMSQYDDSTYNVPQTLHENGYMTGHIGKWHLMTPDDNGEDRNCDRLPYVINETLYNTCKDIIQQQTGFDFVSALYTENIKPTSPYSHNPEWMIHEAQSFIAQAQDESKPFFLYLATTLCHRPHIITHEVLSRPNTETPKGTLSGDEIPNDTGMKTRQDISETIDALGFGDNDEAACVIWLDDMFGALMQSLSSEVADNTFIVFADDHGMGAKKTLFEHGVRQLQFIRYPPLFPVTGSPQVIADDFVVANYDLAPVIYNVSNITLSSEYVIDGQSWIQDVLNDEATTSKERYSDYESGHMIATKKHKYIFKAINDNPSSDEEFYEDSDDLEQLYHLVSDPTEQINLLNTDLSSGVEKYLAEYRAKMIKYIKEIACPLTDVDECITPITPNCPASNEVVFTKQWNVNQVTPQIKINKRNQAEAAFIRQKYEECFDLKNFHDTEYAYSWDWDETESILAIEMIVCCPQYSSFYGKYDASHKIDNVQSASDQLPMFKVLKPSDSEPHSYRLSVMWITIIMVALVALILFDVWWVVQACKKKRKKQRKKVDEFAFW